AAAKDAEVCGCALLPHCAACGFSSPGRSLPNLRSPYAADRAAPSAPIPDLPSANGSQPPGAMTLRRRRDRRLSARAPSLLTQDQLISYLLPCHHPTAYPLWLSF